MEAPDAVLEIVTKIGAIARSDDTMIDVPSPSSLHASKGVSTKRRPANAGINLAVKLSEPKMLNTILVRTV
jgi:hypothetical protein